MWQRGHVTVAHEHLATQIVADQLARLRNVSEPEKRVGRQVVMSAIESDDHRLGAAMVALVLQADGWDVQLLGGGVPVPDLLAFVADRRPDLVGLSVTLSSSMAGAQETIDALAALAERPKILVGGAAFDGDETIARAIGADGFAVDAEAARAEARRLIGLPDPRASLDDYLIALGSRIQEARKARGWSQQTLAGHTGLTRPYLSSVELGKRNLSLGTLLKIARALDVTPESLLA
jgi:methanogenic corrinoid protein MtbC1/DNA-binding XRE family transcriptional regulator